MGAAPVCEVLVEARRAQQVLVFLECDAGWVNVWRYDDVVPAESKRVTLSGGSLLKRSNCKSTGTSEFEISTRKPYLPYMGQ